MMYIRFHNSGLFQSWSKYKKPYHLLLKGYPKEFESNPDYYQICIKDEDLVGVELRDDLEEYKKEQELILKENSNFVI